MKNRLIRLLSLLILLASKSVFASEQVQDGNIQSKLNQETRENLLKAMHGEAFAYIKYLLYAEKAREEGKESLAVLFKETAEIERFEHFKELADIYGLVGNSEENLKDAISGEVYEATKMYINFADKAEAVGDQKAADRFREIASDESSHAKAFQYQLNQLSRLRLPN